MVKRWSVSKESNFFGPHRGDMESLWAKIEILKTNKNYEINKRQKIKHGKRKINMEFMAVDYN